MTDSSWKFKRIDRLCISLNRDEIQQIQNWYFDGKIYLIWNSLKNMQDLMNQMMSLVVMMKYFFRIRTRSDYSHQNVARDLQDTIQEKSMWKEFQCSVPENFALDFFDGINYEYDTFGRFEKRIEKFKKDLKIFKEGTKESFYFAVLYSAFFRLDETRDTLIEDREVLCFSYRTLKLSREKERERLYLDLDFNTLERQCQEINYLLIEKKLFLRVCELKKKVQIPPQERNAKKQSSNRFVGLYWGTFWWVWNSRNLMGKEKKRPFFCSI